MVLINDLGTGLVGAAVAIAMQVSLGYSRPLYMRCSRISTRVAGTGVHCASLIRASLIRRETQGGEDGGG